MHKLRIVKIIIVAVVLSGCETSNLMDNNQDGVAKINTEKHEEKTTISDSSEKAPEYLAPNNKPQQFFNAPAPVGVAALSDADGIEINFSDTDIAVVAEAIFTDALDMPYFIDPQISGKISLQAGRKLGRTELLSTFEAILRLQNIAMVNHSGTINLIPLKDASKKISALSTTVNDSGYGIFIAPLKYMGPLEMENILRPFSPDGGVLRVDSQRNLLLLSGTSQEIETMNEIIHTFDVDWLSKMSISLVPVNHVDAKIIANELDIIFSNEKNPLYGIVQIIPMQRIQSLLVITSNSRYLSEVENWVKRFDISTSSPERRIYSYDIQNGKSEEIAESINTILGGSPSRSSENTTKSAYSAQQNSKPLVLSDSSQNSDSSIRIVPDLENNSLLIYATPLEYKMVLETLKSIDTVPIQVLIEASIAEVTLTDDLRFGINWSYNSSQGPIVFSNSANGAVNQSFPGLSHLYTGKTDIKAALNTLESLTKVRVLSSPKLIVLNNREAQLQVGDQVPIATQASVSTDTANAPIVNSVQLHDTGVILSVIPRANKSGRILLEINQEVSNVVPTTTSEINSPTIQQRRISSTVSIEDGQTIALGGLIKETKSNSRSGIPFLARIPFLGALFGNTSVTTNRTELIVLVTPRVIRTSEESDKVTNLLKNEFINLKYSMEQLNRNLSKMDHEISN
jgi:general secretion pathway protein D